MNTFKLINVRRPVILVGYDSETHCDIMGEADYLLATIDPFNDGGERVTVRLAFADYAYLQDEWEAESSDNTILIESLGTAVVALKADDPTMGTGMIAEQRIACVAQEVTYL